MKFYTNYSTPLQLGEKNNQPSMTVPDQSMTIPEIIARFVRTGSLPVSAHTDTGDCEAFDPDFDPLDQSPEVNEFNLKSLSDQLNKSKDVDNPASTAPENPEPNPSTNPKTR